jgi:hypothetical protein
MSIAIVLGIHLLTLNFNFDVFLPENF